MSLDKSKIKPVPVQKTLLLVNNFIINTTQFFNAFSETVEKKVSRVSNKITEIEILLAVLEVKLNSIPGLEYQSETLPDTVPADATVTASDAPAPSGGGSAPSSAIAANSESGGASASSDITAIDEDPVTAPEAAEVNAASNLVDDPDYGPLCKMLKFRVPLPVVLGKAGAMGLDPAPLEEYFNSL